jgi:hypothetical protein
VCVCVCENHATDYAVSNDTAQCNGRNVVTISRGPIRVITAVFVWM